MHHLDDGRLALRGGARDLRTSASGDAEVLEEAHVAAMVSKNRLLEELEVVPVAEIASLLGVPVSRGFRSAVDQAVPSHRAQHSPLYLLLDELPVAALISGYATMYANEGDVGLTGAQLARGWGPRVDVCAGWRSDGVMMTAIATEGVLPTPVGPFAPILERQDDSLAWHAIPPLDVGEMRRQRLIDVAVSGDVLGVSAMFRDTYVDQVGDKTVLHEYELEMEVDRDTKIVSRCNAMPRTLPWPECPGAAASARLLEGHAVGNLRTLVKTDLRGTGTCTHLNDLLRTLGHVGVLAETLD